MFTDRFLCHRRGAKLTTEERALLEAGVSEVLTLDSRQMMVRAGQPLVHSILLIDGFLCRYIDDRRGMRQLVAFHVPGDFVDLHGYPLHMLDHDVATLTAATVANIRHDTLDTMLDGRPELARKLWYSTLLDAAIHRAWLFRLGRLDAGGRIAHFLCETSARLEAVGLSDGSRFELGITQLDLAEICGLTSVHINRVMRSLREQGIVSFRSSLVEIHDLERLKRRGEFDPAYLYLDRTAFGAPRTEDPK
ncbi:MAG: Crp/Fnr family transcriptional regulator [Rhizorhabdus sp.]|nr:Crp/Fnr family transcriptional regulator [Rhizorhabdus sp.]